MSETNDTLDRSSNRTVAEKLQGTVIDESPQNFFVQFGENDADVVPKTSLNEILFDEDRYTADLEVLFAEGEVSYDYSEDRGLASIFGSNDTEKIHVRTENDGNYFELAEEGQITPVPGNHKESVLDIVTDAEKTTKKSGERLHDLRMDIENGYVNRHKVGSFLDRFPSDRVRVTRNGWVVDDSFVVQYDAENHLVDDPGTFERSGGAVEPVDEEAEFLGDLTFDIRGSLETEAPDGSEYTLDEKEQRFLATVEVLINPEDNLGHDLAGEVIENRSAVDPDEITSSDAINETASTASYAKFKDPKEGQVHGHTLEKHTLKASYSVTDEVIDRLHYPQNGHAGLAELSRRETEFRNATFDVFHDTDNRDDDRWRQIKNATGSAPISDETRDHLNSMFGGV